MRQVHGGFVSIQSLSLTGLCVGLMSSLLSCNEWVLAGEVKPPYVIVQADAATEPEKFAVQELAHFLGRVTGASLPVAAESSLQGNASSIYVGWTKYASRNGIDAAKLGQEQWLIRSVDKNLILTGGRPRGTMYAVYEFLEQQVGCHWLDQNTEVIPSKPTLTLGNLDIQGKPWFWSREVFSPWNGPDEKYKFMIRNKMYKPDNSRFAINHASPTGAFYQVYGGPGFVHTFHYYVNASDWFETHPEYFPLNAQGKRVPTYNEQGPGQLCLTHPDVRRLTLEKLRKFIAEDRAKAPHKGYPPRIYAINQNDGGSCWCQCPNCRALVAREGSESGPLIDFINAIAEDIEKDYPDILIQTLAYNKTSKPPKTLKPRRNVIIGWTDLYGLSDLVRPLSHPSNSGQYKEIVEWGKIAPRLGIADDYWIIFGYCKNFPTPYCMIQCIGPDLKLFADMHAETFFAESYVSNEAGENFTALKFWLAYKLLVDPYQPAERLIKIFMDGYYGAASPMMNRYLAYLQERIDKEAEFIMLRAAPQNLKYLDMNFFVTAEKLFDEAQSRVKPGSLEAQHVERERFIVDGALLFLWPWLDRKLAQDAVMPFDHETVVRRYETSWRRHVKLYHSQFYSKEGRIDKLAALFRDPKLPEPFRSMPRRDVADFNWLTFSPWYPAHQLFVDDKDAAGEMAATLATPTAVQAAAAAAAAKEGKAEKHDTAVSFGVARGPTVTLKPEEIPQDGKYHLYKIGRINVKPVRSELDKGTYVWALEGRKLGVTVGWLCATNASDRAVNDWDAYISLKFKGPAYVKGSVETNGVWMDRVLLVKPQKGEKSHAAGRRLSTP